MGLFKGMFGSTSKATAVAKSLPWILLENIEQLSDIEEKSKHVPQIIFKHSTTCGISRMVLRMFANNFDLKEKAVDLYFLDLHANRSVSDEVAARFQVWHESPQLLVIKNGQTVFHASHGSITEINLDQFL